MRIGPVLFLIMHVIHLSSGNCRQRVKQLEKKVKKLERRVTAIEKGLCSQRDCPPGFVQYKNNCLLFVMSPGSGRTWSQSRQQCREKGADLVTVNSRRKEKFIGRYVVQNYHKAVEIYTGLIISEEKAATNPFRHTINILNTDSRPKSIRWVRTNQAIQTDTYYKHNQQPPFARWSPKIILGTPMGPKNSSGVCLAQSCVTIGLELEQKPNRNRKSEMSSSGNIRFEFTWRYSCCEGRPMGYICETKRLRYVKCNK